jgi:hypothetical protein
LRTFGCTFMNGHRGCRTSLANFTVVILLAEL